MDGKKPLIVMMKDSCTKKLFQLYEKGYQFFQKRMNMQFEISGHLKRTFHKKGTSTPEVGASM